MKDLYTSKYVTHALDEKSSIMFTYWLSETHEMTEEEYKVEALTQKELMETHKVKYQYADIQSFAFTISLELQEWTNHNVFVDRYEEYEKTAIIISQDYIAQLSVELTIDENSYVPVNVKYFAEKEKAMNWLLGTDK